MGVGGTPEAVSQGALGLRLAKPPLLTATFVGAGQKQSSSPTPDHFQGHGGLSPDVRRVSDAQSNGWFRDGAGRPRVWA